jgi:GTPase SAR1 family protein
MYDITDEKSFEGIQNFWYFEVQNYADPHIQLMLLGNKKDL